VGRARTRPAHQRRTATAAADRRGRAVAGSPGTRRGLGIIPGPRLRSPRNHPPPCFGLRANGVGPWCRADAPLSVGHADLDECGSRSAGRGAWPDTARPVRPRRPRAGARHGSSPSAGRWFGVRPAGGPMKVLLVHNRYRNPGGEDSVYESERDMLRRAGVEVIEYVDDNHRAAEMNPLALAVHATWARDSHRRLLTLMRAERPDVAHFHNTFLMISPAAYYAARSAGVPVVQTLHNPRLHCPAASGFREDRPCSECSGRLFAWPAVLHGCYRNSRAASAAVAGMIGIHRLVGTW